MSKMTTRDKVAIGPVKRTDTEYVTGELAEQLRDFNNSLNLPADQQLTGSMDIHGNPIYDLIDILYWPVAKRFFTEYDHIIPVFSYLFGFSQPARQLALAIVDNIYLIRDAQRRRENESLEPDSED